jgi:hypothetical protein
MGIFLIELDARCRRRGMKSVIAAAAIMAACSQAVAAPSWYYCDPAQAYYPYVKSCPVPWREVIPSMPLDSRPPVARRDQAHATPSPVLSVPEPATHSDKLDAVVKALLGREDYLNDKCRGGSGDNPDTFKFCDERDKVVSELESKGWCYGPVDAFEYQKTWRKCGAGDSLVVAEKANPVSASDASSQGQQIERPREAGHTTAEAQSVVQAANSTLRYKAIDITDLKVDIEDMRGQPVAVFGWLSVIGADLGYLGKRQFDSSPISVKLSGLPREEHKMLLERCGNGCSMAIKGRIGPAWLGKTGIVADGVEVE